MRLTSLLATTHPDGYRIDISWTNPDLAGYPGIRVVRREGTHPATPADGVIVAHGMLQPTGTDVTGGAEFRVRDTGLRGETRYYYALFPYRGDPPDFSIDRANRASALASSANGAGRRMYDQLPAIYRRYDAERQQLRRFVQITGGQLDLLQSCARVLLDLIVLDQVDGGLLSLLGQWIGWRTDHHLEIDRQRNEVREAPSLYQRIGIIPVVESTVKRISGWETRSKEFVHNVFRSNQPPRLNIWARRLAANGDVVTPDTLLSLDHAFDGRPSAVQDDQGVRWVFYHATRRGQCRVWYKTSPTFRLGLQSRALLTGSDVPQLQRDFAQAGVTLAADATVAAAGTLWHVTDATNGRTYVVAEEQDWLTVFETSAAVFSWSPSRPLNAVKGGPDEKHPVTVMQRDTLWVFWATHDRVANRWEIRYRRRRDGAWSAPEVFNHGSVGPVADRRSPVALIDQDDGLWLFWQERVGGRWQVQYNRFDATAAAWELDPAAAFPPDGGADPRVEADLFALVHPDVANRPIWLFWARKAPLASPQPERWTVAFRFKGSTHATASDWSSVGTLPKNDASAHDREPAARVSANGDLAVFWSADRTSAWSIWRAALDPSATPPSWGNASQVTTPPYDHRNALPVPVGADTMLFHGSNASLTYRSEVYRPTETVDLRYAGSDTPHVRHAAKLALRGTFDDFQTYTHDTGETPADWYRRDTLGLFVAPGTLDPSELERGMGRLERVVPEFLPVTDRAVLIPTTGIHSDVAYTYDFAGAAEPRVIVDDYRDSVTPPPADSGLDEGEDFGDDFQ